MEVTVKLRLLLASALLMFVQIAMTHAQETVDVAKITGEQFQMRKLNTPSRDIVLVLTGYFHGMRNNTIIDPQTVKKHEEQVGPYCDAHPDTTLMDAVKNVLGFDK